MADIETAVRPYLQNRHIEGMNKNIALWEQWYMGYDPAFHKYKVWTGTKTVLQRERKSLHAGKMICEAWADLLINEKTDITMNDKDKELLDKIFHRCNFWTKANTLVERAFALGLGAFVVNLRNLEVNADGTFVVNDGNNASVYVETINAKKILPITVENGEITECAFATSNTQNSYITLHLKEKKGNSYEYIIKTLYFKEKDFNHFDREETFNTGSNIAWFRIIHPNIVNNEDVDKSTGISILANHIDQLKAIDTKYDQYDKEFRLGGKRTYVSTTLINYDADGNMIDTFEGTEEELFYIPQGEDGRNLIQTDNADLRTSAFNEALNGELSMLGYSCGFGKNYFTFNASNGGGRPIQTATGVMAQNADLFRSVHKHEIIIEQALKGIVQAIIYASNTYTNEKFVKLADEDINIIFDDSIFEDKESEKNSARQDISAGIMSVKEYRMKFYGEDEKTANEKIADNATLIGQLGQALLPLLQAKAITPELFAKFVFNSEDSALISTLANVQQQEQAPDMSEMMKGLNLGA